MIKIAGWLVFLTVGAHAATSFEYSVFRERLPRQEAGRVSISKAGVTYRSDHGKTMIDIPLSNVFKADVSDPRIIRVETFDIVKRRLLDRRVHVFKLRDGTHNDSLARFLSGAVQRPAVGSFGPASQPDGGIRAYHRHRFGGCHGTIHIDESAIRFQSERPGDSRTWLYRDVETVGTMNPFHFRVSTLAETFNFDLKERLHEADFDGVTRRVYSLAPAIPAKMAPNAAQKLE